MSVSQYSRRIFPHSEFIQVYNNFLAAIAVSLQLGMTLEFLSCKILENFMRNEFRISRKYAPCFAKFRVSRKWLKHAKASFACFVFRETKLVATESETSNEKTLFLSD